MGGQLSSANQKCTNIQCKCAPLCKIYIDKAQSIIHEIKNDYDKALYAQSQALLIKKQYLRKICKESVKVSFMDNVEYKDLCNSQYEKELSDIYLRHNMVLFINFKSKGTLMTKYLKAFVFIIAITSIAEAETRSPQYGSGSSDGYQGNSGQQYQYDMNNGNDRLGYSTDVGAQQRDMYSDMYNNSANQNRQQDESNGQYGGGIYSGN